MTAAADQKHPVLEPGEFLARVTHVDRRAVPGAAASQWTHLVGYAMDPVSLVETVGVELAGLAFAGSVARIEVEDHAGIVRAFDVTLKIKSWGEVTEVKSS
jgi:hypothetical protein